VRPRTPPGTRPAPTAYLSTPDGGATAWLETSDDPDAEPVGWLRTDAADRSTTFRFDSTESCAAEAERRGMTSVQVRDVRRIRWLIEELRISLFVQPIGTAGPVSERRIYRAMTTFPRSPRPSALPDGRSGGDPARYGLTSNDCPVLIRLPEMAARSSSSAIRFPTSALRTGPTAAE